jgi:hypothetical protein
MSPEIAPDMYDFHVFFQWSRQSSQELDWGSDRPPENTLSQPAFSDCMGAGLALNWRRFGGARYP